MRKLNRRWLVAGATSLTLMATGVSNAFADGEPGVGHGFHAGTVPMTTAHNGEQYELRDSTRGGMNYYYYQFTSPTLPPVTFAAPDNDWGNLSKLDKETQAVDAFYAVAKAWDYFANVHGRTGIDGNGLGVNLHGYTPSHRDAQVLPSFAPADSTHQDVRLILGNTGQVGATNPGIYYYQANTSTLDLVGGAFAKGVAVTAAGLPVKWVNDSSGNNPIEKAEPAGLADATAAIFGTMIEFYANNRRDTPDYIIGDRVRPGANGVPATARLQHGLEISMAKPAQSSGQPANAANYDCWSATTKNSRYPATHFFYLLAAGSNPQQGETSPTCNNMPVTGIGNEKAAKIWYRALTVYFTGLTNYHAARTATLKAAADLYGVHGVEYNTVDSAWAAISVIGPNPFPGGQRPNPVNPGDQETAVRTATTLQLQATNPGGRALTYTAVGLPAGLTIDQTTGVISGTPTVKGEYRVSIGVTDTLHAQGSTWFMWYVV